MRRIAESAYGLGRSLQILDLILMDGGCNNLTAIARNAELPVASFHRIASIFLASEFLTRSRRGTYVAGPAVLRLKYAIDERKILEKIAYPLMKALSTGTDCVVHLGLLEDDMVTYLLKVGRAAETLFTRESMQLEAYCTGLGKVLVAYLDALERERYLNMGPFVQLTPNTQTDPDLLRVELMQISDRAYAIDNQESLLRLRCVAVPIHWPDGNVHAAISVSDASGASIDELVRRWVPALTAASSEISRRMFGRSKCPSLHSAKVQGDTAL